ncbi:MAG: glycoside hydrolase family 3 protein [Epsilonproteobacteria bacterium]|nr:glycoside hydrolase family 3 protein [Campylobacterota bacterium]
MYPNSWIYNAICKQNLGGVILFNKIGKNIKNIKDIKQLKELTSQIKSCNKDIFIAIDEEGGFVDRLKLISKYPSAKSISDKDIYYAKNIYSNMAKNLAYLGINFNLAPVVDLALNPKNRVIVGFKRSFGKDPIKVATYAKIFIEEMHKYNILTSLKHFPGHGSSFKDTHKGFVDVTNIWNPKELIPYKILIKQKLTDTIMVAHIFNKKLDPNYPASLSKNIITNLLRKNLGFRGVVISDDLQMGAISKYYSLKDRIRLAINAGIDIMLFSNQTSIKNQITLNRLIKITKELLRENKIDISQINRAYNRIQKVKNRLKGN